MATLTAIDVLPLVQARAQASTGKSYPGATAPVCPRRTGLGRRVDHLPGPAATNQP
jgi:hypothetical protein